MFNFNDTKTKKNRRAIDQPDSCSIKFSNKLCFCVFVCVCVCVSQIIRCFFLCLFDIFSCCAIIIFFFCSFFLPLLVCKRKCKTFMLQLKKKKREKKIVIKTLQKITHDFRCAKCRSNQCSFKRAVANTNKCSDSLRLLSVLFMI